MTNDEQIFLANAYLDGELTDAERRLAEADPTVMAEVEDLRALRSRLRDVEPPSDRAREAAIASAMAAFAPAAATAAAPPPVITHRARPGYARYLAIAAAVVGVGLLGVVIANRPASDDAATSEIDSASTADPALEATTADRALSEAAADTADAADAADAAGGAPAEDLAEEVVVAEAAPSDVAADGDEPAAEELADDEADAAPMAVLPPGAGESREYPLASPDELGLYGGHLVRQRDEGRLPPTPNTDCLAPGVLGRAHLVVDGVAEEVLVAVDEPNQLVAAIDQETCDVEVQAPLRF